jgi:hypothetical protein
MANRSAPNGRVGGAASFAAYPDAQCRIWRGPEARAPPLFPNTAGNRLPPIARAPGLMGTVPFQIT